MTVPEHTPDLITDLPENGVFVFGSNPHGNHGGGAAKLARNRFGARSGQGVGLAGSSYAIPTTAGIEMFTREALAFVEFARARPELTFYLTKVGCGISGYTEAEVSPLFAGTPANVVKPLGW